ncbi:hypothetical protein POVCU2_0070490 [Plasmodium ovale curtisi]|uniref:Uncharacterized protein n=1 Tax=Plasmodium ovale curtisi TaxID=864141 RepID=A0A1A8WKS4_PLAOA|nr:hypothetical protein POVCU2_0070490 [Plasmodium ovale curtisi]
MKEPYEKHENGETSKDTVKTPEISSQLDAACHEVDPKSNEFNDVFKMVASVKKEISERSESRNIIEKECTLKYDVPEEQVEEEEPEKILSSSLLGKKNVNNKEINHNFDHEENEFPIYYSECFNVNPRNERLRIARCSSWKLLVNFYTLD